MFCLYRRQHFLVCISSWCFFQRCCSPQAWLACGCPALPVTPRVHPLRCPSCFRSSSAICSEDAAVLLLAKNPGSSFPANGAPALPGFPAATVGDRLREALRSPVPPSPPLARHVKKAPKVSASAATSKAPLPAPLRVVQVQPLSTRRAGSFRSPSGCPLSLPPSPACCGMRWVNGLETRTLSATCRQRVFSVFRQLLHRVSPPR